MVFIPLNDVIPCPGLQICAAHQKSNYTIRIISLTAILKPKGPVKIEEALSFAATFHPPPGLGSDWATLVAGAIGSPVFPTSVVNRTVGESAVISPINITAGSSLADIRRALTSSHLLNRQCTNNFVLQLAHTFVAPEPVVIIAPPGPQRIPVNMQIGLDVARLQREYMQIRSDRSLKEGFINVPLFRRIRSSSSAHDQFVMTIFGFWIQYLMDVHKETRPELFMESGKPAPFLLRKDKDGNELITQCEIGAPTDDRTLYNSYITVPKMLVVDLYTHLLVPACNDATSRFFDTDNGLNICFRQPGNIALQDANITFRMVYEQLTITTSNSPAQEQLSFMDDFSTTSNPSIYTW